MDFREKIFPPNLVWSSPVWSAWYSVQSSQSSQVQSILVSEPVHSGPVGPVSDPGLGSGLVRSNPVWSPVWSLVPSGSGRTKHQSYKRRHQSSPWCFFLMQNIDLLTCEQIANRQMLFAQWSNDYKGRMIFGDPF